MTYRGETTAAYKAWLKELQPQEQAMAEVLDGYFASRSNLPGENMFNHQQLAQDDKTSQEIIDDLAEMCEISMPLVVDYMRHNDFVMVPTADGRMKWAIWRDLNACMNSCD